MRYGKRRLWSGLNGRQKLWIVAWAVLGLLLMAAVANNYWLGRQLREARAAREELSQAEIEAVRAEVSEAARAEVEAVVAELTMERGKLAAAYDEMYQMRLELETLRGNTVAWLDENGVRTDRMSGFYCTRDPMGESLVETDAEFREYCQQNYPQAVYLSSEWTAEEVIQSYQTHPEIWGFWPDHYSQAGFYFVWLPDYEHCFMLYSGYLPESMAYGELTDGWLIVDGVRVRFYGKTVGKVDPQSLTEAYRKGEWDGLPVRSEDWGTTVYVNPDGVLDYFYAAYYYDESYDPEGLAYTGYKEPWWAGEVEPEVADRMEKAFYYDTDELGGTMAFGEVQVRMSAD